MSKLKDEYTPAEVIKWLRKFHGNKKFSWFNCSGGCLFTHFIRAKSRNKFALISLSGYLRDYPKTGNLCFNRRPPVPFHDLFWLKVPGKSVTAARAIKILQTLIPA